MKDLERSFKETLEAFCEFPLTKRELKKLLSTLFEQMFKELATKGHFSFPKGYGSLRIKQTKPFEFTKKTGEEIKAPGRWVIRYYPGQVVRDGLVEHFKRH